MLFQSQEEIMRVFVDWSTNFAPKNLIQTGEVGDRNAQLLAGYALDRGAVTVGSLNEAVAALGDQLQYTRQKSQAEQAREFEAKENARIRKEREDNLAKSKAFDNLPLTNAQTKEARIQADAQKAIDSIIAKYSVNGQTPGTFDRRKEEAGRAALRSIRVTTNGKYDAVSTLKVVSVCFHFDTPNEILAAAQRELESWTNKDEKAREANRRNGLGIGVGNLPRYN